MNKNFKEKLTSRCNGIVKKHNWLRWPMVVYVAIAMSVYHVGMHFARNGKKYSCAVLFVFFAFISSSFSTPERLASQRAAMTPTQDGVQLAEEQELDEEKVASIEDDEEEMEMQLADDEFMDLADEEIDTYTLDDILASNSGYASKIESDGTWQEETEDKGEAIDYADYEFDKEDWRLILVNKQNSIPDDYEFPLGTISGDMKCDERVIEDLLAMMQAAKDDNINLIICSPYRDLKRQIYLFERKINTYMDAGMSYIEAYKKACVTVTSPNASEHQIGLAFDIYTQSHMLLNKAFAKTDAGKWLAAHCYEYGFILRYPEGKEYLTGVQYEPWHFRYVGVEAATVITKEGITLEEFLEDL